MTILIPDSVRQQLLLDFEMEDEQTDSFINRFADKIAYMLDRQPDLLFSYFYRLDIDEHEIGKILQNQSELPTNVALAQLLLQRQIQRAETKIKYKQEVRNDWMDEWD